MSNHKTALRLDKYLGDMGYGTRNELQKMIRKGSVTVNGQVVKRPETKVSITEDQVALDGELLRYRTDIYLLMNKPAGVISATSDPKGQEMTVIELLDDDYYFFGVAPVGRLDKDAVGLLLLTNDGKYNHQMTSPKKGIVKTYYAVVGGSYNPLMKQQFTQGITLDDGYACKPAKLYTLDEYIEETGKAYLKEQCHEYMPEGKITANTYEVVLQITEGKFHQVKRMFASLGHKVLYLKRIGFGPFTLPQGLNEGEVVEVFPFETEI